MFSIAGFDADFRFQALPTQLERSQRERLDPQNLNAQTGSMVAHLTRRCSQAWLRLVLAPAHELSAQLFQGDPEKDNQECVHLKAVAAIFEAGKKVRNSGCPTAITWAAQRAERFRYKGSA